MSNTPFPIIDLLSWEERQNFNFRFADSPSQVSELLDLVEIMDNEYLGEKENNAIERVLKILQHVGYLKPSRLCKILNQCIDETDPLIKKNHVPNGLYPREEVIESAIYFNNIDFNPDLPWLIWIEFVVPEKTPIATVKKAVSLFSEKTGLKLHFSGKRLKGDESEIFTTKEDTDQYEGLNQDVYKIYIGVDDEDLLPLIPNYPEKKKTPKATKKKTTDAERIAQLEAELAALKAQQQ